MYVCTVETNQQKKTRNMITQINWNDGTKTYKNSKRKIVTENENKALILLDYLNSNPEYKKEFLNYSYSEQKTAVKLLIALKKI